MADAKDALPPASAPPATDKPVDALQTGVIAKGTSELARAAMVPVVANAGARCPRCGNRLENAPACSRCKVDPTSADAAARLVPQGSWQRELLRGASYVPRGFWLIFTTPRLWPVAALPLILNIVCFVVVTLGVWWATDEVIKNYASATALENWTGWWVIGAYIIKFIAALAYYLKFLMVPLITAWLMAAPPFSILLRAIFTPFATLVSERAEQIVLKLPEANEPFDFGKLQASIVLGIVDSLLLAIIQIVLYVILLPVALIPPVWMILPPALMAAMDHTDPTFCRKNYYTREKVALWRLRRWRFFGFGLTFFFLLGIPFVNAVIFPVAAAGCALLYLELDRK